LDLGLKFSEITNVSSKEFAEAIAIYIDALPAAERQTIDTIKERVASRKEKLFIGAVDGEIVIMALIWPLAGSSFALFDYFAVKKEQRSHGVGSSFLRNLFEVTRLEDKTFVFEVDDPAYGEDREIRRRRVAFYSRNGVKQLKGVHYILPALQGTTTTDMILMVMSKDNRDSLPGELVKRVIKQIYRELYGRGEDNSLLNSFINTVPGKVDIVQAEVTG
jgi:hypothetical protein